MGCAPGDVSPAQLQPVPRAPTCSVTAQARKANSAGLKLCRV